MKCTHDKLCMKLGFLYTNISRWTVNYTYKKPQYQLLFQCIPLPRERQEMMVTLISG